MKKLSEIQSLTQEFASRINAPARLLPTFRTPIGDGTPNIEVDNFGLYHYVISERGMEFERKSTPDLNELMYWIFSDVTFCMAIEYEFKNRVEDKDSRRMSFPKQVELLAILDKDWAETAHKKHNSILIDHPFKDVTS